MNATDMPNLIFWSFQQMRLFRMDFNQFCRCKVFFIAPGGQKQSQKMTLLPVAGGRRVDPHCGRMFQLLVYSAPVDNVEISLPDRLKIV